MVKENNNENKVKKLKKLKRPLNDVVNNDIEKSKKFKQQFDLPGGNKINNHGINKTNWFVTLNTKNIDDVKQEPLDTSNNNGSVEICDALNFDDINLNNNSFSNDTPSKKKKKKKKKKHLQKGNIDNDNSANNSNENKITSTDNESKVNNNAETITNDNIKNNKFKTKKSQKTPISNEFISSSDESADEEDKKSKKKKLKRKKSTSKNTEDSSDQESNSFPLISQVVQTPLEPKNDPDIFGNDENENTSFVPKKKLSKSYSPKKIKIPEPAIADVSYSEDDDDEFDGNSENCELSTEDVMKLRKMHIKLNHEPPAQHFIERHAGSTTLTPTERERFNQYVKLKRGSFVPQEDDILRKNWQDFCSLNDWNENNVKPFLSLRHNYGYYIPYVEERKRFLRFLGKGLNNRSLYSIFRHFKILYEKKKVSRYTSQEDAFIIKCLNHSLKRNICSMIAAKLKRTNQSVWRRIKILQARDDQLSRRKINKSNENK